MSTNSIQLNELQTTIQSMQAETQARLERIESALAVIIHLVRHRDPGNPNWLPNMPDSPNSCPVTDSPQSAVPRLQLRISNIETTWFTKRPYPSFVVEVVDEHGQVMTRTPHWRLRLRLLSATGLYVDRFLNSPSLDFAVNAGRATISGLKFSAVTSRNGGHFRLEFGLRSPDSEGILPVLSAPLRILSERLKNELKATSTSELRSSDPIVRVPGIGKRYTTKLAERGFHTLFDLRGAFDKSNPDQAKAMSMKEFLSEIERDRGTLTCARITNILDSASQVEVEDEAHDASCAESLDMDAFPHLEMETNPLPEDDAFNVDSFLDPNALRSPLMSATEPPLKRARPSSFDAEYAFGTLLGLANIAPQMALDHSQLLTAHN